MLDDKFNIRIKKHEENIDRRKNTYNLVAYGRLLIFAVLVYLIYKSVKTDYNIGYVFTAFVALSAFIAVVVYHRIISEDINFSKEIININKRYLSRIYGSWIDFKDTGEEFINKDHRYSSDLDIVGKESLFQLINLTNTSTGRKNLAQSLLEPNYNEEEIALRQKAVSEIHSKLDFCQQMEYTTGRYKEKLKDPESLLKYVDEDSTLIKSKIIRNIIYMMPIITLPVSAAIIIFNIKRLYIFIGLIIIMQLLIWGIGVIKLNDILSKVNNFKNNLETYVNILKLIEKEIFVSEKLKSIKERFYNENSSALTAIKQLEGIAEKINLRRSGVLYVISNALLLWDYQCVFSLETWKLKYGGKISDWLEAIGELEGLMSLSVLMHINEKTCFPEIRKSSLSVEALGLGHPLINNKDRVVNDVSMKDNIFIITGSNMSGKTTFLRTIGINLVLAYSGAAVCAENMNCSILKIYTSMRINDELKNGISTFYAELLRIKDIIISSASGETMIFLIDEIFRGTNSNDRIIGAKNVLSNLNKTGVIGAITTHDLELCILDKYSRIKNYHFSEQYRENKIFFDYKLKEGKSTSTNAKFLMKMVGIKIME